MKKLGRSSKPETSMSPAEQWDAINEQVLAKPLPRQVSASSTWDEDEIDLLPFDSTIATVRKKDTIDFLLYMLDPPVRLVTLENEPQAYKDARQTPNQTDSPNGIPDGWDIDMTLDQALRRYQERLAKNPTYDYRIPLPESHSHSFLPEVRFRSLVGNVFRKFKAPYKVGASLYIYHQMQFLGKSAAPSLGKSQWMVDSVPIHEVQAIPHKRRGDPRKIGENWRTYFPASHYWAAFVVLAGNPFTPPENALTRLILQYDVEEFKRFAATFLHFRRSLRDAAAGDGIPSEPHILRALDTDLTHSDFGDTLPVPDDDIPILIEDFQWQWLEKYSSAKQEAALRRPRISVRPRDKSGW